MGILFCPFDKAHKYILDFYKSNNNNNNNNNKIYFKYYIWWIYGKN